MVDRAAPLLVFDSGVGGLSVLAHIQAHLPQAPIVYCADTAAFPYGTKTEAALEAHVPALLERLCRTVQPRLVVIACNTASTIALERVRARLNLPVVGTVPAIKPAAQITQSKVIGILGTPATVRQRYVDDLVAQFAQDCTVLRSGSSALVALAEQHLHGEAPERAAFAACLAGLLEQPDGDRLDTIVLACTHFPLVKDQLAAVSPRLLNWVDSGAGIARHVARLCAGQPWPSVLPAGVFLSTASAALPEVFKTNLARFGLTRVESFTS
jgi:glutamate racemase